MARSRLGDLLDIDVPVIQAPIGSACTPALAAAVSDAGGLGMLALTWHDPARAAAEETWWRMTTGAATGATKIACRSPA